MSTMSSFIFRGVLLVALCAGAPLASADTRTKSGGLFVLGQVGFGGAGAGTEILNTDLTYSGGAGFLNVQIGGEVGEHLVLFGKVYGISVQDPEVEFGNYKAEADGNGYFAGIGGGLAYRSPTRLILSVALTGSRMGLDTANEDYTTDPGAMLHFGVAKAWPVAPHVGLGVGIEAAFGGFPDGDDNDEDYDWAGGYFTLAFTATYD